MSIDSYKKRNPKIDSVLDAVKSFERIYIRFWCDTREDINAFLTDAEKTKIEGKKSSEEMSEDS